MSDLRIHKRRVPVHVHLANRMSLGGKLYSELHKPDGTPATILDRLNDTLEKFLPIAMDDNHCLLQKSKIVSVELQDEEVGTPTTEGLKEQLVDAVLSTGKTCHGRVRAYLPPARSRVLDHLNTTAQNFIPLWESERIVLINVDHIVSVTEVLTS